MLQGYARCGRSTSGERLGPYSALAHLSRVLLSMQKVGRFVEIVSPVYATPVFRAPGSHLVDASGQYRASVRAIGAHPGHLRLWAGRSRPGGARGPRKSRYILCMFGFAFAAGAGAAGPQGPGAESRTVYGTRNVHKLCARLMHMPCTLDFWHCRLRRLCVPCAHAPRSSAAAA